MLTHSDVAYPLATFFKAFLVTFVIYFLEEDAKLETAQSKSLLPTYWRHWKVEVIGCVEVRICINQYKPKLSKLSTANSLKQKMSRRVEPEAKGSEPGLACTRFSTSMPRLFQDFLQSYKVYKVFLLGLFECWRKPFGLTQHSLGFGKEGCSIILCRNDGGMPWPN